MREPRNIYRNKTKKSSKALESRKNNNTNRALKTNSREEVI